MPAQPRSFIDAFSGTAEIKQAYLLIGWIAVNHARIEQRLSYLAWQLEVFDLAGRKKYRNKTDAEIRTLAKERRIDPKRPVGRIEDFVNMVEEHLAKQRAARRLQEAARAEFLPEWKDLGASLIDASQKRNQIIHSAVTWSNGSPGGLIRESTWQHDQPPVPLDLERDAQFRESLGNLFKSLATFTTRLGAVLPFKGDYNVIQ